MNLYQKFVAWWYSMTFWRQLIVLFLSVYVAFWLGRFIGGLIWFP